MADGKRQEKSLQSAFSSGKTHCEQRERPRGTVSPSLHSVPIRVRLHHQLPPVPVTEVCLQKPGFLKKREAIHDFLTIIIENLAESDRGENLVTALSA